MTAKMNASFDDLGSGQPIVFLHGVGSGRKGWTNQVECVTSAGWRFIAIDAPGFGDTPLPNETGFGPHVKAVLDVLDSLEIENAVLCGHSLGGMTAQEIHARYPDRVSGLILSATSPAFGKADGDFQKSFLKARFEPFDQGMLMPEFAAAFVPKLVGSNPRPQAEREIVQAMSAVSIEAYRLAMRTITGFDQRSNLPNIKVPVLLIAGEQDTNAPAPMMAKMADKIDGAEYVQLAKTGHMAPIENPFAFNTHLTQFLKQLSKA